jgi:hypothetical protein
MESNAKLTDDIQRLTAQVGMSSLAWNLFSGFLLSIIESSFSEALQASDIASKKEISELKVANVKLLEENIGLKAENQRLLSAADGMSSLWQVRTVFFLPFISLESPRGRGGVGGDLNAPEPRKKRERSRSQSGILLLLYVACVT